MPLGIWPRTLIGMDVWSHGGMYEAVLVQKGEAVP